MSHMEHAKNENAHDDELLVLARQLVAKLHARDESGTAKVLNAITRMHETGLFQQVGTLTRELHEALNSFSLEPCVASLVDKEIPDARDRLNYVITLTEQSADRTLNAVDTCLPLINALLSGAQVISMGRAESLSAEATGTAAETLHPRVGEFLELAARNGAIIHTNLSDIMQAQQFQDLAGQVIRQVTNLIQRVETSLVELIRMSGDTLRGRVEENTEQQRVVGSECFGPAVTQGHKADAVASQDEVDDLLASMGF